MITLSSPSALEHGTKHQSAAGGTPDAGQRWRFPELPNGNPAAAQAGGLTGTVVDRFGLPVLARVLIRDSSRAVVRECYTGSARAGCSAGRFETYGLPPGAYVVEVVAPGFAPESRCGVRVESLQMADVGRVRLVRVDSPSITLRPGRDHSAPRFPSAGWQGAG
jgi:hypothetical protein